MHGQKNIILQTGCQTKKENESEGHIGMSEETMKKIVT